MSQEDEKKEIMMKFFMDYYKKITKDTPDDKLAEQYYEYYRDEYPWNQKLRILKTHIGRFELDTSDRTRKQYFGTLRGFNELRSAPIVKLPSTPIVKLEPEPEPEPEPELESKKQRGSEEYIDSLKKEEEQFV